jgi:prepilin-type N-terminal cleavage/methylation domain-containing protein
MLDTGFWMLDTGFQMKDAHRIHDAECRMQDARFKIQIEASIIRIRYHASCILYPETNIRNKGDTSMFPKEQFTLKDKTGNSGFTLIEVLVAVAIFAIGILALTSLQAVYIGGNSSARMQTEATTLAAQWLERLKILPYAHDDLDPAGNPHRQVVGAYRIEWNVADNSPINEVKNIRVTVRPVNLRGRPVNLDYRRAEDWR